MLNLKKGQTVRVRADGSNGDWTTGTLLLVSPNGESAGVMLDGGVCVPDGIVAGFLPLVIDMEAETVTDLMGHRYEVEVGAQREGGQ